MVVVIGLNVLQLKFASLQRIISKIKIFRNGGRDRKLSLDFFSAWLSALLRGNKMRWHWEEKYLTRACSYCCFEWLCSCSTGARLIHSSAMSIIYRFIQQMQCFSFKLSFLMDVIMLNLIALYYSSEIFRYLCHWLVEE